MFFRTEWIVFESIQNANPFYCLLSGGKCINSYFILAGLLRPPFYSIKYSHLCLVIWVRGILIIPAHKNLCHPRSLSSRSFKAAGLSASMDLLHHWCKWWSFTKQSLSPRGQVPLQAPLHSRNMVWAWKGCKVDPLILTILPRCLKCMCPINCKKNLHFIHL